ncbi:MAG: CheR family methyltransferase, partial [Gaiellaceae bacterium]
MSTVDEEFERLLEYVRDARSFDYTGYRRPTLMRRFEKRAQTVGASGWSGYQAYLEEHPQEFGELFNTILINVTGFFRDTETWDVVASEVIPRLLAETDGDGPLRVWSAGCSSGEEPYTISMLLAEALGDDAYKARVKIYATDVDDDALAQARDASYTAKQLAELSDSRRERFFQPANGGGFVFRGDLRRSVIFGRNDLHKDPPISRVDLLVSRNTLMYFGTEIQERILANFFFALNRGGFLVVGKAEALQKGPQLFESYNLKRRIYVKDGSADLGFHVTRPPMLPETDAPPELGDVAFEHAQVAQLLVDHETNLAAVNQSARALFGLKPKDVGRSLQDLDVASRPVELAPLIDETRRTRRATVVQGVEFSLRGGAERWFDVHVAPLAGISDKLVGVSVAFVDATVHRALEGQLDRTRRELDSAYDELQSTVEELETTNEELQSANEELETMNEELQSTNNELQAINTELRERTDELDTMNVFMDSVLASVHVGVVVIDADMRVRIWNGRSEDLWGLRAGEVIGEPFLGLDIGLPVERLAGPIRECIA